MNVYLRCWINKYNKVQKKKYLSALEKYYKTNHVRNKMFNFWMMATSKEVQRKIHSINLYGGYEQRTKEKVFN